MMSNKNKAVLYAYDKGYRVINNVISIENRIIKGSITRGGYRMFTIRIKGINAHVLVHKLIAYQKFGNNIFKEGIQVRHLDSDKLNNNDSNIAIGTPKDNASDKNPDDVMRAVLIAASYAKKYDHEKIIEMHRNGYSYSDIMRIFNIPSKGTISFIINKNNAKIKKTHINSSIGRALVSKTRG